jgi:hypothetical protein
MLNASNEPSPTSATSVGLPDATTLEQALGVLSGICGARVVPDDGGEIKELHIIATPYRAPRKIIRDIESLLLVQYGYRIDYRRISLAQAGDATREANDRIELGRVDQVPTSEGMVIEVELLDGQHKVCSTYPLDDDAAYAAGMATVAALNKLLAPAALLSLRGVQCSVIGMRQVVTVYVMYSDTEHLLGTAFVRSSVAAATARAVFAATNRRLTDWLQGDKPLAIAGMVAA